MTVRLGDIAIDSRNPTAAAEFWCAALGYRVVGTDETGVAIAGDPSAPTTLRPVDARPATTRSPGW